MNEELKQYLELAKNYLAKKERANYYETEGYDDDYCRSAYMLSELSDEEANKLKALKEKYGKEFVKHLKEVIDDDDVISDLFYGEPVDIDLENIYHQYRFTAHELKGDGKVWTRSLLIQLPDEDYAKLLAYYLFDENMVINTLLYRDEALFKLISKKVLQNLLDEGCYMSSLPYTVTMDEAIEDSQKIAKENNIPQGGGYRWLGI